MRADGATLSAVIGCRGLLWIDDLYIEVRILNSRQCWDRIDMYVEPIAGSGRKWVSADRVRIDETAEGRS